MISIKGEESKMELKYQLRIKQYEILENDGTRPIEDDVNCITVAYKDGKAVKAILTVNTDIETMLEKYGFVMRTVEDPSKLTKIADFFNEK